MATRKPNGKPVATNITVDSATIALPTRATRTTKTKTKSPGAKSVNLSQPLPKGQTPAVKKTETLVVAQIDIGFGNHLTIRGQGANLNWHTGQAMTWQDNAWVWKTPSKDTFEFKVLINDQVWQQGENIMATAGSKVVFTPRF